MSDGYALPLQEALVIALRADPTLSAEIAGRVYDEPPQGVEYPYVRIGAIAPRPLRTDGKSAAEVTFGIEVYSRPVAGRVECTRICEAVVAAIDEQTLTIANYDTVLIHWITTTVDRESNGRDYTGIVAFRTLLDG